MKNNLLFADIGNSTLDLLITDGKGYRRTKAIAGDREALEDFFSVSPLVHAYISSVNQTGFDFLVSYLNEHDIPYSSLNPEIMSEYSEKHGYTIENTSYLGQDLFADVIAPENEGDIIVIDLGTASKILYLDRDKVFHGCAIIPGVSSFPETLNLKTDLLWKANLDSKSPLVSLKTEECISSGAINGNASMISGMVKAIIEEYHCVNTKVILTGGNAYLVKDALVRFGLTGFETDSNLVMEGIAKTFGYEDYQTLKEK